MKTFKILTPAQLPHVHVRSFYPTVQQGRGLTRKLRKPGALTNKHHAANQVLLGGQPWHLWRRMWFAYFNRLWTNALTLAERIWWKQQAALALVTNNRGVIGHLTGKQFFLWYQTNMLDLRMDTHMPFPQGAADFPKQFTPPWNPPTLELPTIVTATLPGIVVVRALNKTPDDEPCESIFQWTLHPKVAGGWETNKHPWYWTESEPENGHTLYTTHILTPFPFMLGPMRATLTHTYYLPDIPDTAVQLDPNTATNIPVAPPVPWTNPDNSLVLDNVYATAWLDDGYTDKLETTNYLPNIPANATITGIQVVVFARDQNLATDIAKACLTYSGGQESDTLDYTHDWEYRRFYFLIGTSTSLWGRTWTPAEINAPDFGVRFQAGTSHGPYAGAAPNVDAIWIFVSYRVGKGFFTTPMLINFAIA